MILEALERAQGNKTKAAGLLGISRRALYSRMESHSIPIGATEPEPSEQLSRSEEPRRQVHTIPYRPGTPAASRDPDRLRRAPRHGPGCCR